MFLTSHSHPICIHHIFRDSFSGYQEQAIEWPWVSTVSWRRRAPSTTLMWIESSLTRAGIPARLTMGNRSAGQKGTWLPALLAAMCTFSPVPSEAGLVASTAGCCSADFPDGLLPWMSYTASVWMSSVLFRSRWGKDRAGRWCQGAQQIQGLASSHTTAHI